jgi:Activator of Hsp90 ATPase homolog 1-like protein
VIEPLVIEVDLRCSAAHAFATWTQSFGTWWPAGHRSSDDPRATVHLEPRLGGRIYERTGDGREIDWGEVTEWDPPRRLGYLWHLRRDRAGATDVRVDFVENHGGVSRIRIEHTGWERLGEEGPSWRDANRGGWSGLLPHFIEAAESYS